MICILSLALVLPCAPGEPGPGAAIDDAAAACRRLGRGINMGNALEAPTEGAWGMRLEASYFAAVRAAGFDSVRLPVRWSAHAGKEPPYTIDAAFLERVDWAVDQALANHLGVVLNFHHYEELYAQPAEEQARFLALWKQVAQHFRGRPADVVLEILNEPHGKLDDTHWNPMLVAALDLIRGSNPDRFVMIGPTQWNGFRQLPELELPSSDRRLIVTFHYYEPMELTHQGAAWAGPNATKWLGTTWTGTPEQTQKIKNDFDAVADWAKAHDRPIYLGEFGAYEKAPMPSRAAWTAAVARAAEARGFSWAYWEFGAGFGAYDREAKSWRSPLLQALVPSPSR
jgi:endoglucanase